MQELIYFGSGTKSGFYQAWPHQFPGQDDTYFEAWSVFGFKKKKSPGSERDIIIYYISLLLSDLYESVPGPKYMYYNMGIRTLYIQGLCPCVEMTYLRFRSISGFYQIGPGPGPD